MGSGKGGGGGGGTIAPQIAPEETYQGGAESEKESSSDAAWKAMTEYMENMQQSFQDQMDALAEENERLRKEQEENALIQERENSYDEIEMLWQARLEAESTAIETVDDEIEEERANADLRGLDYELTPEDRESRIQEYFEEYWDVEYETQLNTLMKDYGSPEMTEEERLAVEQGTSEFYWEPDIKYSNFFYGTGEEEDEEEAETVSLTGDEETEASVARSQKTIQSSLGAESLLAESEASLL